MKFLTSILIAIVCLAFLSAAINCSEDEQTNNEIPSSRLKFQLPKIFDFGKYMEMFNRRYNSLVETLARRKVYMAHAFGAFISAVAYKHEKADYYLGINGLSDKTNEELERMLMKSSDDDEENVTDDTEEPVASEEEVKQELESIIAADGSGAKEIAEELISGKREKRDISKRRRLNIDEDLYPNKDGEKESSKAVKTIPSNNPDYQPIEAPSQGDEGTSEADRYAMSEERASYLSMLPGSGFLKRIASNLQGAMYQYLYPDEKLTEEQVARLSPKERRKYKERQRIKRRLKPAKTDLPDQVWVDHRRSECFQKIKDQYDCGSCYIFSTVALYEWQFCMQQGKSIAFSEQFILDCGKDKFKNIGGCEGGLETDVGYFVARYGLELDRNYPYEAREGVCPYVDWVGTEVMGYLKLDGMTSLRRVDDDEIEETLAKSPILFGIKVPRDFFHYKGGVHQGNNIMNKGLHAMPLIGHGVEDGNEYWLFRNSYGADWGEDGYFKLSKAAKVWKTDNLDGYVLNLRDPKRKFVRENRRHLKPEFMRKYFGSDKTSEETSDYVPAEGAIVNKRRKMENEQ